MKTYFECMTQVRPAIVSIVFGVMGTAVIAASPAQTSGAEASVVKATYAEVESDATKRINLSNRLKMLTQRVAAASCALTSNVATDESFAALKASEQEIDQIINALQHGDDAMNVNGPEQSKMILAKIQYVAEAWQPTRAALGAVLADGQDTDSAHVIDDENLKLLELTDTLAAKISGAYADPFQVTQTDALKIEIAGRVRMLSQKMAKDSCEVWTGYNADAAKKDLASTMAMFDMSLKALHEGMPALGLPPAPTPEIKAELETLIDRWEVIKANQTILANGGEIDAATKAEIFTDLSLELAPLDALVLGYTAYAERGQ